MTIKFVIVSVRLILLRVEVDGYTGQQEESDVRQETIFISDQRYKRGNRRYFSVISERISKFLIVFVRMILRKAGFDGFTGPRRESDVR